MYSHSHTKSVGAVGSIIETGTKWAPAVAWNQHQSKFTYLFAISIHPADFSNHRNRRDTYLDTLLANQTARKASPPIIPKIAITRWRTARVIVEINAVLTNHSKAGRQR